MDRHPTDDLRRNPDGTLRRVDPQGHTVNRDTQAGPDGKVITCPICGTGTRVFHFAWSALQCDGCEEFVDKNSWRNPVKVWRERTT